MVPFKIVGENIRNGYACVVNWNTFMGSIDFYIEKAINHFELKDYENVLNMLIKQFHIVKQNLHGFIKQSIIWHWVI